MADERSTTQRTLDVLKDEWTRPYRDALGELLESLTHVDVTGPRGAMEDYVECEHTATELLALGQEGS